MNVIHLSVECFPLAKVGGLADVVGALPKYQRKIGINAAVVMPCYDRPAVHQLHTEIVYSGHIHQGSELLAYEVLHEQGESLGFPIYLIHIPGKLDRPEVYCYPDEAEQWISFQHAFLDFLNHHPEIVPDILHCHDHHVGLIPFLVQYGNDFSKLSAIKTVFTVHNGQYQGWMSWSKAILLPGFDTWKWGLLDWSGMINPLAAAIKCADAYNTVSRGYLQELLEEANGLESLFAQERAKSYGIINGIDTEVWNPETDVCLEKKYSKRSVVGGKGANKAALAKRVGFDAKQPLLSFIGRFATEKGADLLAEVIEKVFAVSDNKLTIFILGSGDDQIRSQLEQIQARFSDTVKAFFGYDEVLAHQVYAGSDFLLMPSRVEPCGLNQMYAMRYGTIPIVRGIGGLRDTVLDVDREGGYGIVFDSLDTDEVKEAIDRAMALYAEMSSFKQLQKRIMTLDFSWESSAAEYRKMYDKLIG